MQSFVFLPQIKELTQILKIILILLICGYTFYFANLAKGFTQFSATD